MRAAWRAKCASGKRAPQPTAPNRRHRAPRDGARSLRRVLDRGVARPGHVIVMQYERDELTGNLIRARPIGRARSRRHMRGMTFAAWLDDRAAAGRLQRNPKSGRGSGRIRR
jgi:hypothetical protein